MEQELNTILTTLSSWKTSRNPPTSTHILTSGDDANVGVAKTGGWSPRGVPGDTQGRGTKAQSSRDIPKMSPPKWDVFCGPLSPKWTAY